MKPVNTGNGQGVTGLATFTSLIETRELSAHSLDPMPLTRTGTFPLAVRVAWWQSEQARRSFNVLMAALLLILMLPVMLVVALLVWITSPGPVLYRQTRVGVDRRQGSQINANWRRHVNYGGELFQIYKFRTMYIDADRAGQVWALQDDPRITPLGRFLRKYRLDELPQLFNVLRGDMNLVGPRPEQPVIFAELREKIDRYPARQRVLPGITGWAQINQHYDSCLEDVRKKLFYDLEYLHRRSIAEDIKILVKTVPVVLLKKGAW
jgi:lipopolysaccharide/colanic/teichoic acid biosynthesis glycosyltransferase